MPSLDGLQAATCLSMHRTSVWVWCWGNDLHYWMNVACRCAVVTASDQPSISQWCSIGDINDHFPIHKAWTIKPVCKWVSVVLLKQPQGGKLKQTWYKHRLEQTLCSFRFSLRAIRLGHQHAGCCLVKALLACSLKNNRIKYSWIKILLNLRTSVTFVDHPYYQMQWSMIPTVSMWHGV